MSDSGLEKFILDKLEKLDDKLDQVREESTKLSLSLKSHEQRDEDIHRDVKDMAEKFSAQLDEQCKALKEYNKQLEVHIKGVQLLEDGQKKMWERVEPVVKAHEDKKVINNYFSQKAKTRMKWVAGIGTVVGTLYGILKLLSIL